MGTTTESSQKAAQARRFEAAVGQSCRECEIVILSTTNQSTVYPGFCKACGSSKWGAVVRRSVDKRISSHVGLACRECGDTVLTGSNQSRSYPGVCRSCYNRRSAQTIKQHRPRRLQDTINSTCRACGLATLTNETQSRSLIGFCKSCASLYFYTKRHHKLHLVSVNSTSCRECHTSLDETNISKSHPSICKSCQNNRHSSYIKRYAEKYLGTLCQFCHSTTLTDETQSKTNPKFCYGCALKRNKLTFDSYLTLPCSKCEITLTRENQSKGHLGKCKSCRNAEQICSVCGNRGGVYKGKRCKPCKDAGYTLQTLHRT